jgi:hypothetical protein
MINGDNNTRIPNIFTGKLIAKISEKKVKIKKLIRKIIITNMVLTRRERKINVFNSFFFPNERYRGIK